MLDLDGAFFGPDREALLRRHERYASAFAAAIESPAAGLTVAGPSSFRSSPDIGQVTPHVRLTAGIPSLSPRFVVNPAIGAADGWCPTVWVAGDPFKTGPLQLGAAMRTGGRLQVQVHGDFGRWDKRRSSFWMHAKMTIARVVLRAADSIRVVTEEQGDSMVRKFNLRPERVFVAPVPIDEVFTSTPIGEVERPSRVLFVGRLHEERGLGTWAQAAREVARREPAVTFAVIGTGPSEPQFRAMLEGLPVTWHGRLEPADVARIMGGSRVLLSTPPLESYGRSLTEALCMGARVVATDTTGARRLRGEPSVTVTSKPEELAEAAVAALSGSISREQTQEFRARQVAVDAEAVNALARSWR